MQEALVERVKRAVQQPVDIRLHDLPDASGTQLIIAAPLDSGGRGRPRVSQSPCMSPFPVLSPLLAIVHPAIPPNPAIFLQVLVRVQENVTGCTAGSFWLQAQLKICWMSAPPSFSASIALCDLCSPVSQASLDMHDVAKVWVTALCCCCAGLGLTPGQSNLNLADAWLTSDAMQSGCLCVASCNIDIPLSSWPASSIESVLTNVDLQTNTG